MQLHAANSRLRLEELRVELRILLLKVMRALEEEKVAPCRVVHWPSSLVLQAKVIALSFHRASSSTGILRHPFDFLVAEAPSSSVARRLGYPIVLLFLEID